MTIHFPSKDVPVIISNLMQTLSTLAHGEKHFYKHALLRPVFYAVIDDAFSNSAEHLLKI